LHDKWLTSKAMCYDAGTSIWDLSLARYYASSQPYKGFFSECSTGFNREPRSISYRYRPAGHRIYNRNHNGNTQTRYNADFDLTGETGGFEPAMKCVIRFIGEMMGLGIPLRNRLAVGVTPWTGDSLRTRPTTTSGISSVV
jgi:hypothetical protein